MRQVPQRPRHGVLHLKAAENVQRGLIQRPRLCDPSLVEVTVGNPALAVGHSQCFGAIRPQPGAFGEMRCSLLAGAAGQHDLSLVVVRPGKLLAIGQALRASAESALTVTGMFNDGAAKTCSPAMPSATRLVIMIFICGAAVSRSCTRSRGQHLLKVVENQEKMALAQFDAQIAEPRSKRHRRFG